MIAHFVIRPCEREALDKVWCNREARPVLHTGSRRQKRLSLIPSNSIVSWEVMLLPCILFVYRDVGKTWMFCIYKLHGVILRWMSRTVAKPFQPLDQIVRNHAANYTDKERSKIGEEYLCHKHPSFPVKIDRKAVTVSV